MNLFELFIKVSVDDQASGQLDSIGTKMGGGLQKAAKIGIAAVSAATTAIVSLTKQAVSSFAEYEQLAGGAQKIFDQMDYSKIAKDASNAYIELGMSANQYLSVINDVGAAFASTMGDAAGYETAKKGLKAISDYASGTGKSVDELSQKFTLITRSTSSYQSIADQFSGILPATSKGFLDQAKAAGLLSEEYDKLTDVPIAEYQAAVSEMLEQGVEDIGLYNNTMEEAFTTISGSIAMTKSAWDNLITGLADDNANLGPLITSFADSAMIAFDNIVPKVQTAMDGAAQLIGTLVPQIIQKIPEIITENLPVILSSGVSLIQNLVNGIATAVPYIIEEMPNVIGAFLGFIEENLGSFVESGSSALVSLVDGIIGAIPDMLSRLPEIISSFTNFVTENLPTIFEMGSETLASLVDGIIENIPYLLSELPKVISAFVDFVTQSLPTIVESGVDVLVSLVTGIIESIPTLIAETPKIITSFVSTIIEKLPEIISSGGEIILALIEGIIGAIPELVKALPEIITAIVDGITNLMSDIIGIGGAIIDGIKQGIQNAWEAFTGWVGGLFGGLVDGVKGLLGIQSPSKVFAEIGTNMAAGISEGWGDEFGKVKGEIEDGMHFSAGSVEFKDSGLGISSSGIVNGVSSSVSSGSYDSRPISINLVLPDGTALARYLLDPLANYAKANGTPILNPN